MKKFFSEFKTFIAKGNVMDLAVGMIIGSMFTAIVNSLVNDIINPFISLAIGKTSFDDMFFVLNGNGEIYASLEEAKAAGVAVIGYGHLIQLVLNFLITAIILFFVVKGINKIRESSKKEEKKEEKEEK